MTTADICAAPSMPTIATVPISSRADSRGATSMHNGTVCLTFDFDALSSWLYNGMTSPASISRGEFSAVAVPRILSMLARRGIRATWFIPGHTVEVYRRECEAVVAAGHEVG